MNNHSEITLCNVGKIGIGNYIPSINRIYTESYNTWRRMIKRCYSSAYFERNTTYKDCTVCDEWHDYQNFAKWYENNYYEVKEQRMELDKDILFKGNKIYSPKTCIFVPQEINVLFNKQQLKRGDLPIGVSLKTKTGKYQAGCRYNKIKKHLGYFTSPEDAFKAYKK